MSHLTHTGHELSRARAHEGDRGDRPATPSASDLAQRLQGLNFPADKAAILDCAKRQHINHRLLDRLERLPDQSYREAADISRALGQMS